MINLLLLTICVVLPACYDPNNFDIDQIDNQDYFDVHLTKDSLKANGLDELEIVVILDNETRKSDRQGCELRPTLAH